MRIEKYNGWFGFENSSKIKTYIDFLTNDSLGLERPVMYMNGGDFVDMYPSRDLYSFIPKWNEYRKRIEKNKCKKQRFGSLLFDIIALVDEVLTGRERYELRLSYYR